MAYLTVSELLATLDSQAVAELSSDGVTPGIDEIEASSGGLLATLIEDATGVMDSYFEERYTTPITPVNQAMRRCCASMCVYYLHMRRSWTVTPEIRTAYEDAIAWLRDVSKGVATLPGQAVTAAVQGSFQANARQYTRLEMEGFL